MPIDLNRTEEIFETSTDLTVGLEEEFAVLDPQTLDLVPRFEELRDVAAEEPGLKEAITGELISSEIEIVSGRGEDIHDATAHQRERRRLLFALAAAAASRSARPARTRGRTTASSRTSTPTTTGGSSRGSATSRGATTRSRCTSTSACATPTAPCSPATGCARSCRCCSPPARAAVSRRATTRCCTPFERQTFTKSFPRCGVPDAYGSWQAFRDYLELLIATNSIVEYTQVWWSVRPHATYGTIEVRIADAQITAAESDGLASLIVACVGQTLRDIDEGVPFDDPPPRLVEENMWRAIRHGMDGHMIDLAAGWRSRRAPRSRICGRGRRRARGAADRPGAGGPNGAQRQRAALVGGAGMREVYADTVRETTTTYAQEVPA